MVLRRWTLGNRNVPLRWVTILPFLGQILVAVGLTGYLSWRSGSQAVNELAEQLGQEATSQVKQYISKFTEVPTLFLAMNESVLSANALESTRPELLQSLFWEQLQFSQQVNALQWGKADGEYLRLEREPHFRMTIRNSATGTNAEVYRLDASGKPRERLQVKAYDPRSQVWYRAAAGAHRVVWSPIYELPDSSELGISPAIAIYNARQQKLGALAVDLRLESLDRFLHSLYATRPNKILILERTGKIVASSSPELNYRKMPGRKERLSATESPDPKIRQVAIAIAQRFGSFERIVGTHWFRLKIEGKPQFVQVTSLTEGRNLDWLLIAIVPESELTAQIRDITYKSIILCLFLLGGAAVLGIYATQAIERPIARFVEASQAIAGGDLERIVPGARILEFEMLAQSLEGMIGELKRSQAQLKVALGRSQEKFAKAFRANPEPMAITTLMEGRILDANDSFLSSSGYTLEEVLNRTPRELNLLATHAELEDAIAKLQQNTQLRDFEARFRTKSGEIRTVLLSGEILELDEIPCVLYIARDITDRKEMETELQQNRQHLRLVLDNIPQQVFWKDRDSVFLGCNKNWAEAACLESPEAVIGLRDEDLLPPEAAAAAERFRESDRRIMENNQAEYNALEVKQRPDANGNPVWLSVSKIPIHDERGETIGILGAIEDITLRKIAEEKRQAAEEALRIEQEKSEQLLLNILPEAIAEQLKQDPSPIAEQFEDVAILFADIVGFTALSTTLPARNLVNFLNRIFSEFDRLAKHHGLEKIKTIGDAYMVAGGLPLPKPDRHQAIAEMALEMQNSIVRVAAEFQRPLQIRIGINTGPVVAGVIGEAKFIYDLWGDTVNVASRMESLSEPGRIQTTQKVYERLKDFYEFEERGEIDVKGKGKTIAYWLIGRKSCTISPTNEEAL